MMKPPRTSRVSPALVPVLASLLLAALGCSKSKEPHPTTPANVRSDAHPPATDDPTSPKVEPAMPKLNADPSAMPAAAAGDLAFARALHAELLKEQGNLFFSPASIRLAMAMTAMGARGKTADELTQGLSLDKDLTKAAAGFAAILNSFAQRSQVTLRPGMSDWEREEAERRASTVAIANRVWPQAGRHFEQAFIDTMAASFGAPMQPLDFAAGTEAARKVINAWVAEQTAQKIPELLLPPHVQPDTKIILTNAIYFKAQWDESFSERATRELPFTTADGAKKPVQMMSRGGFMEYAETPTYQALNLPYADGSLSMTLLLPRKGQSLAEVEAAALADGAAPLTAQRVHLQLPKFKIEARFSLAKTLAKLGMTSAFTYGPADFSGIDGTRELFIGDVVHQAVISVDERGTEAAAATAVGMRAGAAAPTAPPKEFFADRPFAFFLRDAKTGVVLFVGRLADPSAK
ncbi:MAG: serpin family protein [Kofleriaceae bacterium]